MTTRSLPLRLMPVGVLGGRRARYVVERNFLVYRHVWIILFSGFFEPLFYLFAAQVGLGALVGDVALGGESIPYTEFIAPALLAASAMNGAVYESTMNIYHKLKFAKTYDGMLATPLQPFDIAIGEIGWSLIRGALYAIGFLIVLAGTGLLQSVWGILAVPAALLIGFAFGAVGMAATSYMRSWQDFDLVNLALLVLFLFSGTFYPLSVYPPHLQLLAQLSPLYHGVVLIRSFTLGTFDVSLVGHAGFLVVMGVAGLLVAGRRLHRLLLP
jgi:lipooligosaccharide transport system permease protein